MSGVIGTSAKEHVGQERMKGHEELKSMLIMEDLTVSVTPQKMEAVLLGEGHALVRIKEMTLLEVSFGAIF